MIGSRVRGKGGAGRRGEVEGHRTSIYYYYWAVLCYHHHCCHYGGAVQYYRYDTVLSHSDTVEEPLENATVGSDGVRTPTSYKHNQ